jgi:hypothetical protein
VRHGIEAVRRGRGEAARNAVAARPARTRARESGGDGRKKMTGGAELSA